jgi:hypothetical protein
MVLFRELQHSVHCILTEKDVCALHETVHECGWGGVACFQHVAEILYGHVDGQQLSDVCTVFLLGRVEFPGEESESPEKISAIIDMLRPSDVEGLRRFLGMATAHDFCQIIPQPKTLFDRFFERIPCSDGRQHAKQFSLD